MARLTAALAALAVAAASLAAGCTRPQEAPMKVWVKDQALVVELALDPRTRAQGLMFRRELAADAGMLFVEPKDRTLDYWMKNTLIPLSIAFIKADGVILNIADMAVEPVGTQDHERQRYTSHDDCRYALETNLGWFARAGVKAGDRVRFSEAVQARLAEVR